MKLLTFYSGVMVVMISCVSVNRAEEKQSDPQLDQLILPKGFSIEYFAKDVDNARSLAIGDKGTVFVGSRNAGNVYALIDSDKDNIADQKIVLASKLRMPNGVAFYKGDLYFAEVSRIGVFRNIEDNLENAISPEIVSNEFPDDGHHGWKYIAIGPDEKLYVPVGAPCNVCLKDNEIYSTICRMNLDGSDLEVYAKGVRNSVGFDWNPADNSLWFTDNGRDMMGDDIPCDELNRVEKIGDHFGFPYCHAGDVADPRYGKERSCAEFKAPEVKLHPHGASLGMKFIEGNYFPMEYTGDIILAEHGSWNRSKPIGYQLSRVILENGKAKSYEDFVTGWLQDGKAWGRPVDVLQMQDGSLLVSDDFNDCVYRITSSLDT